ncbi:hypothetical protein GW599_21995 [Escherichia coli]|nr:hypothetical protein [Escherichia coli]
MSTSNENLSNKKSPIYQIKQIYIKEDTKAQLMEFIKGINDECQLLVKPTYIVHCLLNCALQSEGIRKEVINYVTNAREKMR